MLARVCDVFNRRNLLAVTDTNRLITTCKLVQYGSIKDIHQHVVDRSQHRSSNSPGPQSDKEGPVGRTAFDGGLDADGQLIAARLIQSQIVEVTFVVNGEKLVEISADHQLLGRRSDQLDARQQLGLVRGPYSAEPLEANFIYVEGKRSVLSGATSIWR